MNNQRWLSMSFLTFFFTWGVFLPYWTGWLTIEKDLSVSAASVIMGAGMIARSLSTFFIFPYITNRMSMSRAIKVLSMIALGLSLLYIPISSFNSLLIVTILFSIVYPIILPAVESSASILMQTDRIHYGKSRSFGSIGYTSALLLIGAATAFWSEKAILYIMIASLFTLVLFSLQQTPIVLQHHSTNKEPAQKGFELKKLLSMKSFVTVMILATLLQGAHASYYNYGFIFLSDLGVNGFYIGIILNVAVLFEILFFSRADRLLANMKVSTIFLIAGIGSTVRWVLVFLFPFTSVFIASQVLHAVSFGIAHFAFIQFVSVRLPQNLIPTAQGMYAAFAMSLSVALLTFIGGWLYDLSPGFAFLGMISCTVPAILIVLFTRKRFSY